MPVGTVLPFAGDNAPTGFVLCDGALYDKVGTMAALYAVIGNTYGEAGGQFNVPDLRNRFPVGAGDAYSRGETGGSATTILDVTSLPAHSHDVTDPGHTHAGSGGSFVIETEGSAYDHAEGDVGSSAAETEQAQTGITIEETGDGAPFNTMPPYIALNYIIRY
jgi:microcystin-dependent protein